MRVSDGRRRGRRAHDGASAGRGLRAHGRASAGRAAAWVSRAWRPGSRTGEIPRSCGESDTQIPLMRAGEDQSSHHHDMHSCAPIAPYSGDILELVIVELQEAPSHPRRTVPRRLGASGATVPIVRRHDPRTEQARRTSSPPSILPHEHSPAGVTAHECGPDVHPFRQPDHGNCGQLMTVEERFILPPQAPFFHILWILFGNILHFVHNSSFYGRRTVGSSHIECTSESREARTGRR